MPAPLVPGGVLRKRRFFMQSARAFTSSVSVPLATIGDLVYVPPGIVHSTGNASYTFTPNFKVYYSARLRPKV